MHRKFVLYLLFYRMYDDELQNFDELQYFHELQNFLQSNFGEKEPRKCPECTKCKDDSIPKYFVSLGSLKEHLLEHYRVKYYLEHVRFSLGL